jgi:hypothetical protein
LTDPSFALASQEGSLFLERTALVAAELPTEMAPFIFVDICEFNRALEQEDRIRRKVHRNLLREPTYFNVDEFVFQCLSNVVIITTRAVAEIRVLFE